jgi:ribosomal protein S27AE
MTMFNKCPGAANIRRPTIIRKKCPECGEEVELFSDEMQVKCGNCGFTVYKEIESCILWCKYAKECVGEERYKKLKMKEWWTEWQK